MVLSLRFCALTSMRWAPNLLKPPFSGHLLGEAHSHHTNKGTKFLSALSFYTFPFLGSVQHILLFKAVLLLWFTVCLLYPNVFHKRRNFSCLFTVCPCASNSVWHTREGLIHIWWMNDSILVLMSDGLAQTIVFAFISTSKQMFLGYSGTPLQTLEFSTFFPTLYLSSTIWCFVQTRTPACLFRSATWQFF